MAELGDAAAIVAHPVGRLHPLVRFEHLFFCGEIESETLFEPRKVWIGYETDRYVAIESGVGEGEEVVTTGSFLLKTELLKGSIGAGCCEVAPGK